MFIKLLGPMEATRNGAVITPSAKKPRKVLALLAMRPGELVTQDSMVEELWGMKVPRSARQTLQSYVLQLRRLIGANMPPGARGAREVLVTRPLGYTLEIGPDHVDVHHYEEQAAAGHRAAELGDDEAASRLCGAALDEWRGPVLVDVSAGPVLGIEVTRLAQSRLGVLEVRIDADLRLGRHHRLLDELAGLTARYPMHEKLCMQYMTALHLSGCTWRALEAFQVLRKRLVTELGIEPTSRARQLQLAILNADSEPEPARTWACQHPQPA